MRGQTPADAEPAAETARVRRLHALLAAEIAAASARARGTSAAPTGGQELPAAPVAVELDDVTVTIDRATAGEARRRALATACPTTRPGRGSATRSAPCSSGRGSTGSSRTWRTRRNSPSCSAGSATCPRSSRRVRRS